MSGAYLMKPSRLGKEAKCLKLKRKGLSIELIYNLEFSIEFFYNKINKEIHLIDE